MSKPWKSLPSFLLKSEIQFNLSDHSILFLTYFVIPDELNCPKPPTPTEKSQLRNLSTSILVISAAFIILIISLLTILLISQKSRRGRTHEIEPYPYPTSSTARDPSISVSNGCLGTHQPGIRLARSYQDQDYDI